MTDSSFEDLIEKYERLVYSICYQFTANHHTAEDLAQETFLSVYRHKDTIPEDNPKAWVARIATNKSKDFLKSAYNRRVAAADDENMPQDKGTLFGREEQPEALLLAKDEAQQLESEIRALKEPYHMVAILFFIEERSVDEISKSLSRPAKTVHTQLYRAKKILQEKIRKGGEIDGAVS